MPKIANVEAIPINVPLKPGLTTKTAHGEHVDSPYVIVRLTTDCGTVGWGEATLAPRWSGETSPGCVAVVEGLFKPLLIGEDPRGVRRLRRRLDSAIRLNPFTKAAVEMALWDLAGKLLGVPLWQLLGGKLRERLPLKMVVGAFEPAQAVALAEQFLQRGARWLKVKVGLQLEQDIERVRAIRRLAGPAVPLGIDANCGWSVCDTRRALAALEDVDLQFVEQPLGAAAHRESALLRDSLAVPLMADESVFSVADAWQVCAAGAADLLSVYPGKHGGILGTLEVAAVAKAAGLSCSMGSNLELGIATAAMLHVGAVCEAIDSERFPGDYIGPLYHEADLLQTPLELGPEDAVVPDGPGLGIEVDLAQLETYRDRSGRAEALGTPSGLTFGD